MTFIFADALPILPMALVESVVEGLFIITIAQGRADCLPDGMAYFEQRNARRWDRELAMKM